VGKLTFPLAGNAYTIGITGPTGSGKSTLTERLISTIRSTGDDVGVLAVDPSSPFSGGAFLGDRVRMQSHATDEGVFIRSMATRGHLGGLSLATPEAISAICSGVAWTSCWPMASRSWPTGRSSPCRSSKSTRPC